MTEAMRLLYNYTLDNQFLSCLYTQEYRFADVLADRLTDKLRQALPGENRALLGKYQDAVTEQQRLELEAMFQAAFSLAKELG